MEALMNMVLTLRQAITRREYRRGWVTQAELAQRFGVSQSAISRRLAATREADAPQPAGRIRRKVLHPLSLDPARA